MLENMNNNPYAEAYLQMNPVVARSYMERNGGQLPFRSNYTLTSEHQKIICVLIMLALACYVIGFAIIMIRQVIRDTEQRATEENSCDCVKYNGEHCDEKCLGTSDLLIDDERSTTLKDSQSNKTIKQEPIEISVNMDGTYCREQTNRENNKLNLAKSANQMDDKSSIDLSTKSILPINMKRNLETNNLPNNLAECLFLNSPSSKLPSSNSLTKNKFTTNDKSTATNRCYSSYSFSYNGLITDDQLNKSSNDKTNKIDKENLDFKQTEIHSNLDQIKLFKKVRSFLDYSKQNKKLKSIEHL